MHRLTSALVLLSAVGAALAVTPAARAQSGGSAVPSATPAPSAQTKLTQSLRKDAAQLGAYSGAYVVDLTTGQSLFASSPDGPRTPASVQKLYTTTTALLRFGPGAVLTTSLLGTGQRSSTGVWTGTLYLRGGGDPTFGSAGFDAANYGAGASVQRLVATLQRSAHLTALKGSIVGDGSLFDARPGTIESGFGFDPYMEGALGALTFNRGVSADGQHPMSDPPRFAAAQLAGALRGAHVRVPKGTRTRDGRVPGSARLLASVPSPSIAQLLALTNTPSDNFFAEMLLKGLGARFGAAGTTAAGVAVVRSELAAQFGFVPVFDDGSGLSRDDATTPRQVVALLRGMATNPAFVASLAVGGETGTLQHEMQGTIAQGNCRGKTGTLSDVASLAGYCRAADSHTLAFAFLANRLGDAELGHRIEADMAVALARYRG